MASADDLRRLALALPDTQEAPHFERAAFRVDRIFATLAADGLTANLKFTPDEQALKCEVAPEAFRPVPNAWGEKGYTTLTLAAVSEDELAAALAIAHLHAFKSQRRTKLARRRS